MPKQLSDRTKTELADIVQKQKAENDALKRNAAMVADALKEMENENKQQKEENRNGKNYANKRPLNFVGEQVPYWNLPSKLYNVAAALAREDKEYSQEFLILAALLAANADSSASASNTLNKKLGTTKGDDGKGEEFDAGAALAKIMGK